MRLCQFSLSLILYLDIIDDLLLNKDILDKAYVSWGGDNGINFYLLNKNLYEYINTYSIQGGFGKIVKSV